MKFASILALYVAALASAQAQTITDWSFTQTVAAPDNSPAPSIGNGTATALGMTNSYNATTSVNTDDVTATGGDSINSGFAWRVRGQNPGNGWSSQAPIGSQGAQFNVSTVGYTNINVSFDLYFTTQAPAKMELEYTTDGSNWFNAGDLTYAANSSYIHINSGSDANTATGTYFYETAGQGFYNDITASLTTVTAANNDANFAIRIVNAATGTADVNYQGTAYNNNSGNWRFDNVIISGTPVPVPAAVWLFGSALAGLVGLNRRKSA